MTAKQLKVAVYTRKSTLHGLDQDFNSLEAQREAAEAYIKSQRSEGWALINKQYDDGGISGGTMERPALQKLLQDVEAGRIDIIKVDRLTRSLSDFARIIDRLDKADASFVSVTQQFNTSTSMGRLTLNVLLSFAQFEREVTAERIRDKVLASKQKGMWMGGTVPLGYDNVDKKLIINKEEANTIKNAFEMYLKKPSVKIACHQINQLGYRTKERKGKKPGGIKFSEGHLYYILKNPLYISEILHKGNSFNGTYEPIIDLEIWHQVQEKIKRSKRNRSSGQNFSYPSLLSGLLENTNRQILSPSHANKKGKRYRYYITRPQDPSAEVERYPAEQIENAVRNTIITWLLDETQHLSTENLTGRQKWISMTEVLKFGTPQKQKKLLKTIIKKVILSETQLTLQIQKGALSDNCHSSEEDFITLTKSINFKKGIRGKKIIIPSGKQVLQKTDKKLITLIAKAHLWAKDLQSGKYSTMTELAKKHGVNKADLGKNVRLAYLAPDIINSILESHQPPSLKASYLRKLSNLPSNWNEQRQFLHFI